MLELNGKGKSQEQQRAYQRRLQKALPAFFRAARGHELTEAELKNLADDIRKLHTRDRD